MTPDSAYSPARHLRFQLQYQWLRILSLAFNTRVRAHVPGVFSPTNRSAAHIKPVWLSVIVNLQKSRAHSFWGSPPPLDTGNVQAVSAFQLVISQECSWNRQKLMAEGAVQIKVNSFKFWPQVSCSLRNGFLTGHFCHRVSLSKMFETRFKTT